MEKNIHQSFWQFSDQLRLQTSNFANLSVDNSIWTTSFGSKRPEGRRNTDVNGSSSVDHDGSTWSGTSYSLKSVEGWHSSDLRPTNASHYSLGGGGGSKQAGITYNGSDDVRKAGLNDVLVQSTFLDDSGVIGVKSLKSSSEERRNMDVNEFGSVDHDGSIRRGTYFGFKSLEGRRNFDVRSMNAAENYSPGGGGSKQTGLNEGMVKSSYLNDSGGKSSGGFSKKGIYSRVVDPSRGNNAIVNAGKSAAALNVNSNKNNSSNSGSGADKRFKSLPASESLPRSETIGGYIFVCNNDTMEENLQRQLFGLPSRFRDSVRVITPGLPLFLYNYSTHQLHGIFEAASFGRTNIDSSAWEDKKWRGESRFPAQVSVVTRKVCQPLHEDSFRPVLHHYDGPKFRLELSVPETISLLDIFQEK